MPARKGVPGNYALIPIHGRSLECQRQHRKSREDMNPSPLKARSYIQHGGQAAALENRSVRRGPRCADLAWRLGAVSREDDAEVAQALRGCHGWGVPARPQDGCSRRRDDHGRHGGAHRAATCSQHRQRRGRLRRSLAAARLLHRDGASRAERVADDACHGPQIVGAAQGLHSRRGAVQCEREQRDWVVRAEPFDFTVAAFDCDFRSPPLPLSRSPFCFISRSGSPMSR